MFVKLIFEDLNPNSYPLPPTSTYIYEVTTVLKVCGGKKKKKLKLKTKCVLSLTNR